MNQWLVLTKNDAAKRNPTRAGQKNMELYSNTWHVIDLPENIVLNLKFIV